MSVREHTVHHGPSMAMGRRSRSILCPKLVQLPLHLQECEEVQRCIDMVLRCLVKGLRREGGRAGRLSAMIADWLQLSYTALSTASSPEEWAEFLKAGSWPC